MSSRKRGALQQQIRNGKRTFEERQAAVDAFDLLLKRGCDAKDAATRLRVGRSTIYRDKQFINEQIESRPIYAVPSIDEVFITLTSEKSVSIRTISIIDFLCWMRWPESKQNRCLGSMLCLAVYLSQAGDRLSADFRADIFLVLNQRLSADLLISIMRAISDSA